MLQDPSGSAARNFNLAPLFLPTSPLPVQPDHVVEYAALYAGESAARIHALESAFEVTLMLAQGARDAQGTQAS